MALKPSTRRWLIAVIIIIGVVLLAEWLLIGNRPKTGNQDETKVPPANGR